MKTTKRIAAAVLMNFALAAVSLASDQVDQALLAEIESLKFDNATDENLLRLREIIANTEGETRVRARLKIADLYSKRGQIKDAEDIFNDLAMAYSTFNKELQIKYWIRKGRFEQTRNNYIGAETILRTEVLPMAEPDSPQLAKVYRDLGEYLRNQSKLVEAKSYYDKSLALYQAQGMRLQASRIHNSLGVLMDRLGRVSEALNYQHKALAVAEELGGVGDRGTVNYNLGDLYEQTGDLEKAVSFYLKALELDRQLNDFSNVAYDHFAIARVYLKRDNYQQALFHNLQSIDLRIQQTAIEMLSVSYLQQASIYKAMGNADGRLKSLTLAEDAAVRSKAKNQRRNVNFRFGEYHYDAGSYTKAKERLRQALASSTEMELPKEQYQDASLLAKVYDNLGEHKQANALLTRALDLKQTLHERAQIKETERYKRDINLMQEQMRVRDLEQQKADQERQLREDKLQLHRLIMGFVITLVIFIAIGFVLFQRRRLALLEAKLYHDALEQKDRLFADVSHELRTPLTSLKIQIDALQHNLVEDVDASYQKIGKKVMDINYLITDIYELAQADTGTLELHKQECELEELFDEWDTELQAYVEEQGFVYTSDFTLGEVVMPLDVVRIKQVLFNLTSNSCFYTDKPGEIRITAAVQGNELTVEVDDTAPTVEKKDLSKIFSRLFRVEKSRSRQTGGSGLGLSICKSLIEAHGGTIEASQSSLGGLTIRFTIPYADNP